MKKPILTVLVVALIASLSGCVVVRDRKPDASVTTRQTTVTTPAATTVERTTVY